MNYLIILLLAILLVKLICSCVGIVAGIVIFHKEIREEIIKFCRSGWTERSAKGLGVKA